MLLGLIVVGQGDPPSVSFVYGANRDRRRLYVQRSGWLFQSAWCLRLLTCSNIRALCENGTDFNEASFGPRVHVDLEVSFSYVRLLSKSLPHRIWFVAAESLGS